MSADIFVSALKIYISNARKRCGKKMFKNGRINNLNELLFMERLKTLNTVEALNYPQNYSLLEFPIFEKVFSEREMDFLEYEMS